MIYFIGEKRSEQAIRNNWHWDDNVSTARFLLDCLANIGIHQSNIIFYNLWSDDGILQKEVISELQSNSIPIVGMGKIVCDELDKYEISHMSIIHPAARGKIRKKELYTQHLQDKVGWLAFVDESGWE